MTLTKYKSSTPSLTSWMDDFFSSNLFPTFDGRGLNPRMPAVNIKETNDSFELDMAAPGLDKKDFAVTVENGLLTISSKKEEETQEKDKGYTRREFSYASFSRTFSLPEDVNQDEVTAAYNNGVLRVTLPKSEYAKTKPGRTIKIS